MAKLTKKVVAYITRGDMLLVFSHPDFPEAGLQVPAGTIENDEEAHQAVLREAIEETGLTELKIVEFLGQCNYDMVAFSRDEVQVRYCFHLECLSYTPSSWRHNETDGGKRDPIVFEFRWVRMPHEVPELMAGQGAMLPLLFEKLATLR